MKKYGFKILVFSTLISLFCFWAPPAQATTVWRQVGGDGLGNAGNYLLPTMEVWNGAIYAGVGRAITSARIYRSTNGTTWDLMKDDFLHPGLNTLVDLHPFGTRLYASLGSEAFVPTTAEIWRSDADGDTWTQFGADGLGLPLNGALLNTEFMQFEEFGGKLYVGSRNDVTGGQLFRTDGTTWEEITADGFGVLPAAANEAIWGLMSYDGYLYAGTLNDNGAQIWRSTTGDAGDWTKYFDYATEDAPQYYVTNLFASFKGHLYWSTGSDNGAQIVERLTDDTFDYSIDGLGDANNIRLSENALQVGNYIYFGTMNSPTWGGTGGELWMSQDGLTATQIGADGFGDADNYALYAIAFKSYMYVGFSNADTGLQIWRRLSTSNFHFETEDLPDGTQNQAYSASVKAASGKGAITYAVTDGALPPGLALDKNTGAITGTPTQTGDYEFETTATDSNGKTVRETYTIKIVAGVAIKTLPETGADIADI